MVLYTNLLLSYANFLLFSSVLFKVILIFYKGNVVLGTIEINENNFYC